MSSRPIISYDDITLPYEAQEGSSTGKPPPAKKRKQNNQKSKGKSYGQPRKAPSNRGQSSTLSSNATFVHAASVDVEKGEYEEEESRELSHEEIWDDSALVDAWEAAQQEYEMFHGKEKEWKSEPLKKSALWYNVPIDSSTKQVNGSSFSSKVEVPATATVNPEDESVEDDSQPLNFETFTPTYDPSLPPSVPRPNAASQYMPDTPAGPMVSQDEAFSRALSAMYWGGYWTAMYHCQKHAAQTEQTDEEAADDDGEEEAEEVAGYVTTQR